MTHRSTSLLLLALVVSTSVLASPLGAQDPKMPPVKKFTPAQIAEAEARLAAATCLLHRSEPRRDPWEVYVPREIRPLRFVNTPPEPQMPIDLIGFPSSTTDADLAKLLPFVKRINSVKAVMLWKTEKITAKGLKLLVKELPDIEGLMLNEVTIPDGDLAELASLQSLRWIDVMHCSIRDPGLKELAAIPRLAMLTLRRNVFLGARGLEHLADAKSLRELNVDVAADPPAMVTAIAKLGDLNHLNVYPVGDSEAVKLGQLKKLATLDLTNTDPIVSGKSGVLTDAGLHEFIGCKSLITLRVQGAGITIERLPELVALENLRELSLAGTGTNDAALTIIARMKTLTRLNLARTAVTDKGVRNLTDLPRLEILALSGNRVGDESLEVLTRVRSLQALVMDDTRVAAASINLGSFATLKHLSLQSTNLSLASLKSLEKASSVLVMDLRGNCPNVTPNDIRPLRQALPKSIVLADSCSPGGPGGWPGAQFYVFQLPEVKSPVTPPPQVAKPVPTPMPQGPPPKVAPPQPTGPVGGSGSRP